MLTPPKPLPPLIWQHNFLVCTCKKRKYVKHFVEATERKVANLPNGQKDLWRVRLSQRRKQPARDLAKTILSTWEIDPRGSLLRGSRRFNISLLCFRGFGHRCKIFQHHCQALNHHSRRQTFLAGATLKTKNWPTNALITSTRKETTLLSRTKDTVHR